MTIKDFIKQLSFVEDDIGGNFDIVSIHKANGMIQMKFSNGAITQIMEPSRNPIIKNAGATQTSWGVE